MSKLTTLLLSSAVLATPVAALAQQATPDSATVVAATRTLKSDLRNFVTAQEAYFADHTTYARSLPEWATVFHPSRGVTLVLLTSSGTGHSEIAIDERVPGLVCAMYVGTSPPPLGKGAEGEVVCRGP